MMFDKTIRHIFQIMLAFFFSVSASSAVLGFAGVYQPVLVFVFSALLFAGTGFFLWKQQEQDTPTPSKLPAWASILLVVCAAVILFVLVLYPLVRWPTSHAGDWFPWDAGAYHFPKAVEIYRSGTIWDMNIAYADYPFGYESLLSFCLSLTGDLALFGPLHALMVVFFVCAMWMLARRITKLDGGLLFLLIVLLILSDHFFQFLNLWRVFTLDIYTVGKNDILVAGALLAAIYYFYRAQDSYQQGIFGFALASALAASVKPNSLYVLFPLWLFVFMCFFRAKRVSLLSHALLLVPGLLWLVRNLVALGSVASTDATRLAGWSIAANLTNPYFYQNIPKNLLLAGVLVLLEIILAFKHKQGHYWNAIVALVLFVAFISTPVTAYFEDTQTIPTINWRFGEALLAFLAILIMGNIQGLFLKICKNILNAKVLWIGLCGCALLASGWLIWNQRAMLESVPENAFILHDQFREPVGVDGYYSAYDYVQRNAHDAVVWVENGLPFYTYDAEFSNTVSRQQAADYVLGFRTDWWGEGRTGYPDLIEELQGNVSYETVYEDAQGVVLRKK